MAVKNSEIIAFFEQLASKHKLIAHSAAVKHFYLIELNEFASGNFSFKGFNFILEVMPIKYQAESLDNAFKIREVAFIIVKSLPSVNKLAIAQAFDETETIMDDMLSKLYNAKCGFDNSIISFEPNNIDAHQVSNGKLYGVRCLVDIKSKHSFEVVAANWK